jgi:hypothetical protein
MAEQVATANLTYAHLSRGIAGSNSAFFLTVPGVPKGGAIC